MNDMEDFRRSNTVLRRLNAHLLRRKSPHRRLASAPDCRCDNLNHHSHNEHQQKQTPLVRRRKQK